MAKESLTAEQYKLYKLIWERFMGSLMAACIQSTRSIDIAADDYIFRASGYTVKFDGFTAVYATAKDENEEGESVLPPIAEDDTLVLRELAGNQHFTQPPQDITTPPSSTSWKRPASADPAPMPPQLPPS